MTFPGPPRFQPEGARHEWGGRAARAVNEASAEEGGSMATVEDPVCGMDVDPASAAGSEEHEGTTYHFCSTSCLERFRANPDAFAGGEEG